MAAGTTGATTTLAGSGGAGFNDDDAGTNAQLYYPHGVAIDPNGAFALVAVRAWPCTAPASRPLRRRHAHLAHYLIPAPPPSEVVPAATPRRPGLLLAQRGRARCIAG